MTIYFRFRSVIDLFTSAAVVLIVFLAPASLRLFDFPDVQTAESFGLTMLNTSASLLGFVLAASTFLISHVQHKRFSVLQRAKSYTQLPELVGSNLWRLLLLTIASEITVFVAPGNHKMVMIVMLFLVCWSLTALATLLWVVIRIYSIPLTNE